MESDAVGPEPPAREAARTVAAAWEDLRGTFDAITRRARERFERREWKGILADSVERLGLYRAATDQALAGLGRRLGPRLRHQEAWPALKGAYSRLMEGQKDRVLAETFFNSVTRRIFTTVGVNPAIEFVESDFDPQPGERSPVHQSVAGRDVGALLETLLGRFPLRASWATFAEDVRAVAAQIEALRAWPGEEVAIDYVPALFFRNQGSYLVGRLRAGGLERPLLLALLHRPEGIVVDAVLLTADDAALVFSFTRSYFLVEVDQPGPLVDFLGELMPSKGRHELWTSLGFNKHGKTVLYRSLLGHLRSSDDLFLPARGQRGMVMAVFTLPTFDVVFKVIRDRIERPKDTSRERVMEKYQLVFRHDRAGRLVDAQEFEHLEFARDRFAPALLEDLLETAPGVVSLRGDRVEIRHLYTERRLAPLDLYLREAPPERAERAVLDYGRALRDLAATNIFPGDLLLKNFGVTRQGRVVFYDYDELSLLADCSFRPLPAARCEEDETAAEPWFYVGENDIFPEEFLPFLGLRGRLREVFLEAHGDLLRPAFWAAMQRRLDGGEIPELFPYSADRRLPHRAPP
jgi:isocitrate dehydrogenase kinase/phosphatase